MWKQVQVWVYDNDHSDIIVDCASIDNDELLHLIYIYRTVWNRYGVHRIDIDCSCALACDNNHDHNNNISNNNNNAHCDITNYHTTSNYIYEVNTDCDGNRGTNYCNNVNVNRTNPNVHNLYVYSFISIFE